ncbi:TetR/AcrR family transcriptional regulator [Streptomyces sp. NPDC056653]|uniref:TetR/AcrR family transcriptional regulator n=1 Tax=Streptomyces sp. NPDC056653 TaxID=3345894 RepID=UPI0036BB9754
MDAMKTQPKATTRAEQARQTKAGILTVALRLFSQRGYDATSLQDIADEMGLTKAAVYYHFRSKVELLQAVCEPVCEKISEVIDSAAGLRSRRQKINVIGSGFVEVMLGQRAVMSLLASDPVMSGRVEAARSMDDLLDRVLEAIYGPAPSPEQRLAIYAVPGLGDAIAALPDLTEDELRPLLLRAVKRLVPER